MDSAFAARKDSVISFGATKRSTPSVAPAAIVAGIVSEVVPNEKVSAVAVPSTSLAWKGAASGASDQSVAAFAA